MTIGGTMQTFFSCGGASTVGATIISDTAGHIDAFDCEFSLPLTLRQEVTEQVLFDGRTVIGMLFGQSVQAFVGRDEVGHAVSYEATAPIPLTASLPPMGTGSGVLALLWRRRLS